jgi:acyl carrier protein
MGRNEIFARVTDIVAREVNIIVDNMDLSTRLETIDIDSLDMIKVAAAIEKDFDVTIDTSELMQMNTFGDIVSGLERKLAIAA